MSNHEKSIHKYLACSYARVQLVDGVWLGKLFVSADFEPVEDFMLVRAEEYANVQATS